MELLNVTSKFFSEHIIIGTIVVVNIMYLFNTVVEFVKFARKHNVNIKGEMNNVK